MSTILIRPRFRFSCVVNLTDFPLLDFPFTPQMFPPGACLQWPDSIKACAAIAVGFIRWVLATFWTAGKSFVRHVCFFFGILRSIRCCLGVSPFSTDCGGVHAPVSGVGGMVGTDPGLMDGGIVGTLCTSFCTHDASGSRNV